MTLDEKIMRSSIAVQLLGYVPTIMREALISDTAFSAEMDVETDGEIIFNPAGAAFRRSALMKAVRDASKLDGGGIELPDLHDKPWNILFERTAIPPIVKLSDGNKIANVRHLGLLSEKLDDRVSMLEAEAERVRLPLNSKGHWLELVRERALTDDELSDFAEDLNTTPAIVSTAISGTLNQESVHFDILVPRQSDYYERLVGKWSGQANIKEYAAEVLPDFFAELIVPHKMIGLRQGLLLAGHPVVVDAIAALPVSDEEFQELAHWSVRWGDAIARCAILELAILRASVSEATKPILAEVARSLLPTQTEGDEDFEMLSGAFIFAYGHIANIKLFAGRPTFWRRLAALSQAAMISRCMIPKKGALVEFAHDLRKLRNRSFAMQCYIDMRSGPLWQSQWAFPAQLRNEFVGRVVSRAVSATERARALGLEELLTGEGDQSLRATVNDLFMFIAGPLEDNVPLVQELSGANLEAVERGLADPVPTAASFAALTNAVFIFKTTPELAEKAAQALQRAQYRIEAQDRQHFSAALMGLASCAAATRSVALADAVLTVVRYYRRFMPDLLGMDEALRVGSIACASRADAGEWGMAIGALMSDFAFQTLSKEEALSFNAYLEELCEMAPELWAPCGPALAASAAVGS